MIVPRALVALLNPLRLAALGVALILAATGARADLFEVRGVAVDLTAETANDARIEAFAKAERQAFAKLMDRLLEAEPRSALGEVDAATISNLVLDLSVTREKASATRYIGEFAVRFNREAVRAFLAGRGIAVMVTESPPAVLLPVYREAGALVLWDHPNPWRDAWEAGPIPADLVPLILPEGGLGDLATVSAEGALSGDPAALLNLAGRYSTTDVIVAFADNRPDPASGHPVLALDVRRYGPRTATPILSETLPVPSPGGGDGSLEEALTAAVKRVGEAIDAAWRGASTVNLGGKDAAVLAVTAPITSLRDWLDLQARLKANPAVRKVDVVLLTRQEVRINLHYLGSLQQFGETLRQADLALVRSDDGWTLSVASAVDAGVN